MREQGYEVVSVTRFRRVAAKRLRQSHAEKPPVTLHRWADVQSTLDCLAGLADAAPSGVKLTLTAALAVLVARSLGEDQTLNARTEDGELRRYERVDLAVAVATDEGLVAPVLRDPDGLGIVGVATRLAELADAARGGGLSPDDLADPTFTISGLGAWGVEYFTPIINPPQIAILGIGALQDGDGGGGDDRSRLPLSLTFDHAAVDGVDGARFLQRLAGHLEAPRLEIQT